MSPSARDGTAAGGRGMSVSNAVCTCEASRPMSMCAREAGTAGAGASSYGRLLGHSSSACSTCFSFPFPFAARTLPSVAAAAAFLARAASSASSFLRALSVMKGNSLDVTNTLFGRSISDGGMKGLYACVGSVLRIGVGGREGVGSAAAAGAGTGVVALEAGAGVTTGSSLVPLTPIIPFTNGATGGASTAAGGVGNPSAFPFACSAAS
jgi:hypothetical protein